MHWPLERFTDVIDFIMDNKRWQIPTTPEARVFLQKQKMVVQLRTPQEGLEEHFTKPGTKTHRKHLGGYVDVCAGISNGRIVLWEYYSKWNGEVAASMYKGPIMQALKKHRGSKTSYLIAEDNDPTGYKSRKAIAAKQSLGIKTVSWPRYSPDLMPLDFSLWNDINRRMRKNAPVGLESPWLLKHVSAAWFCGHQRRP